MSAGTRETITILDLPAELFPAIFAWEFSLRDLAVLCRTSKTFNAVTVPILYSSIEWAWFEDRIPPIGLLLRTILKRPDLAAHVRSLILRGATFSRPPFTGKKPPLVPNQPGLNGEKLESAISQATLDSALAESWIAAAREGRMDALVALLLVHLPQLTTLVLETNFAKELSMIGQVILHECTSPGSTSVLQQLQTIKISLETDWNTRNKTIDNTDAVLAMFYLPKTQHIQADIGNPPNMLKWPAAFTPDLSNLTSLDLYSIREPHLGEILMVTQNLRSLSWLWDYDPDILHCSPVVDLDAISAALRHVQQTLTQLNISATTDEGDGVEFRRLTFRGTMDGLRDMQRLETLQAPFVFLLGVPGPGAEERRLEDVVPSTLRHLTITQELGMWGCIVNRDLAWDDEDQYKKIASWLGCSKACSRPYLRSMRLEFGVWSPLEFGLWGIEMQTRLRNLGREVGVDVEIV